MNSFNYSRDRYALRSWSCLAFAFAIAAVATSAQGQRADSAKAAKDTAAPAPFGALKWREIGPFRGGRSVAVAGSSSRPFEYYMGTTGGGVFKTTDGGIGWTPITDKYFGGTIGAIAVSESNPDIVYVGAGEFPIRGNVSHGDGVFKSIDAGKTWTSVGLTQTRQISRVRVHPKNPDIVYVAAQGHVWAPNPERGVFKSSDGGKTWRKVLFRNDSTGGADLAIDPNNPDILYAGLWQTGRTPWKLVSGGQGSGLFKSTDAGETWTEITRNPGLPSGLFGNVGITVSPANPNRVWAIVENDSGGVFRSDDAGATWKLLNSERKLRQRAWYYTKIHADTKDTNTVYVNNVGFHRSTDGGKTYKAIDTPHGDSHDLWIAPNDAQRMIEGNDGGANVSFNAGKSWTDQDFATAQFYHVTTTTDFPYHVCGAQQDNSTICGPSRVPGGIIMKDWYEVAGGESGYIAVRPDDPAVSYGGSYGGLLTRKDRRTGAERAINPWPDNPMGHSAGDLKYRFQWTYPIVISPHNPNVLYAAANVLFRSTNEGQSWTVISPDLTRHDPATLGPSGGPITKDQTSVEYYGTIFTLAESPVRAGVIWAGSDDGMVHLTMDNGATWRDVTPKGLPEWTRISIIDASRHSPGTAYVAANRFQLDDNEPYLYRTTDYGRSWTRVDNGIARGEFTRVIREDPAKRGLLYAGTERGVWVSFDDGANWQTLKLELPPVPVHDLAVKEGDLVAGTHGRSFWILDDLSVLRQYVPTLAEKDAHLYKPREVVRVNWGGGGGGGGGGGEGGDASVGRNPPSGAVIYYSLKQPNQEVTLEFADAAGKVIKKFTSKQDSSAAADSIRGDSVKKVQGDSLAKTGLSPDSIEKLQRQGPAPASEDERPYPPREPRVPNKAGLNMFAWNLRYPDATAFKDMIMWAGGTQGPIAPPGTYTVRMAVNGKPSGTHSIAVRKDPRSRATQAELAEQFRLLITIRDKVSEANSAVRTVRNVKHQLALHTGGPIDGRKVTGPLADAARALAEQLSVIEDSIYQTKNRSGQDPLNYPIRLNNKIAALAGVVASADARPTTQSYAAFRELSAKLDARLARLKAELGTEGQLAKVNALIDAANGSKIVPATAEFIAVKKL